MVKVKAVIDFHDVEAKKDRAAGEVFECTEERLKAFTESAFGCLAERIDEPSEEPAPKKRRTTKKA